MKKGNLKVDLGYQDNLRKELDGPDPELFFDLNTYSVDVKYLRNNEVNDWQPVIGFSSDYANSLNKGEEFLIPNYNNWGLGVFYFSKRDWDKSSFNFGLRYDYSGIEASKFYLKDRWIERNFGANFYRFLILCAGSDEDILKRCPRSEHIKHAGFGALVLVPATLGLFSMTYAISTFVKSPYLYILAGLTWAVIVFIFDRFIISSFRKKSSVLKDVTSLTFLSRLVFFPGLSYFRAVQTGD